MRLFHTGPMVPFDDLARPQAQTGRRRHPARMMSPGQLGHEAKAASTDRTQIGSDSRG
jgi:hypothetical protein